MLYLEAVKCTVYDIDFQFSGKIPVVSDDAEEIPIVVPSGYVNRFPTGKRHCSVQSVTFVWWIDSIIDWSCLEFWKQ